MACAGRPAASGRDGARPGWRSGGHRSCRLPAVALLLGALGLIWALPTTAQAAKTWKVSPQGYTMYEGVPARIVIRLSEAAPAGGLSFTVKPLFGSAVPSDKCVGDWKAAAADIGANPPTILTVPGGSLKAEAAVPTVHDLLAEFDECFAVQFAGAQATVDAGWAADARDGPYGDSSAAEVTIFNVAPPAAPTGLTVTPGGARLDLTWTAPSGSLRGYQVHYTSAAAAAVGNHDAASGNDPAAAWVSVSRSGTAASQAITGLTDGTTYRVRVRAVGSRTSGNPGFWVFGTGEPVETMDAGAPTGLGITVGSGGLRVSWTAPAGAVRSYDVHYTASASIGNNDAASGNNPAAAWVDAGHTGTNAWHRIDGLTNGTTYRVRVRAVNTAGASAWVRGTGTPASSPPAAPAGLVVGSDHRKLNLRWRKPAGTVTSYDVHYTASTAVGNDAASGSNTNPATGWVDAGHAGTATSLAISGLTNGTTYRVRVRAVNASGAGGWARGTGTPLPVMGFGNWAKIASEGETETISVKLSEALQVAATVRIDIDVTRPATQRATETADFTLSATTLSFPAGVTEKSFTVGSLADRTTEGEESFILRLAAPSGARYRVGRILTQNIFEETEVVIEDASRAAGLHIEVDDTVVEGESAKVLVSIGGPAPAGGTAVKLSLAGTGTATEWSDFRLSSKKATIAEGETWAAVTLDALDDAADDNGETVVLKASSANPAHSAQPRSVTIVDNDLPLAPAPQNVKVTPGPLTLTVTWKVPAAAQTIDPHYAVYWAFRRNGAGPGWDRRPRATREQRTARSVTLADSRLTTVPYEVGIWFVYQGEPDPVAAPGVTRRVESGPVTAVGTPLPALPPSVPQNVQIVPGDAVMTLLWQAPSSAGSYQLGGYEIWATGIAPGWQFIPRQIFDSGDPTATSARLKGLVVNNEFPRNGKQYSVRIRAWSKRSGAQSDGNGQYRAEDLAYSGWVTVKGTAITGWPDRPTSLVLTSSVANWHAYEEDGRVVVTQVNRADEHTGTVTLTAMLNTVALSATTVSLTARDASTATATDDYTLSTETLTIAAGARSATATLTIVDDTAVETDEVVQLRATTAGAVVLTSNTHTVTIVDNDEAVAAPTGLTVTAYDGELKLDWTAPSTTPGKVTGYDVEYKEATAGDAPATTAGDPATGWVDAGHTGTAARHTIRDLSNGVAYGVRVRAVSRTGTSSLWTAGNGTPSALTPLATPANFRLTPGDGQITAHWDAVANADEYVLLYGVKGSGTSQWQAVQSRGLNSTVTGLVNGVTYVLAVQALDSTLKYAPSPLPAWSEATPRAAMSADAGLNALRAKGASGADGTYAPLSLAPLPLTDAGAMGYTATVAATTTHVKLTPVAAHAAATVTVDGAAVSSGSSSAAIALAPSGETTIAVRVTAEDGRTVKEYTLTISRHAAQSSDASLIGLSGSTSSDGTTFDGTLTLSPAFASGTAAYTATVANATTHVTLTPTVTHASATVEVRKGSTGGFATVTNGAASAAMALDEGANAIEVRVTAQDGSAKSYMVTVTRPPRAATPETVVTLQVHQTPDEGSQLLVLLLSLTNALSRDVTIPLTMSRGTREDGDHWALEGVTIPAGSHSGLAHIWTAMDGDAVDETVTVALDTANLPPGIRAGTPASVRVTTADHGTDSGPGGAHTVSLHAWPNPVAEGSPVRVRARMSAALGHDVTIPLTVTRSTSEAGDHGMLASITIPRGYRQAEGEITTVVDADLDDEMFTVALDTANLPAGVTAGAPSADGEPAVAVTIADKAHPRHAPTPAVTVTAGAAVSEGSPAAFTLAAAPAPAVDLSVSVTVSENGAFAEASALGARTVTIPAGQASVSFAVATVDDAVDEPDGAVSAALESGTGYTVGNAGSATVVVADNDDPLVTLAAGGPVTEGTPAGFTLTAAPVPAVDLRVSVTVSQNGAFAAPSALGRRTVTIPAGAGSASFEVATVDDAVDEPDGAIVATLESGTGYTVGNAGSATVVVADNDEPPPAIVTQRGHAREGTDDAVVFTVLLDRAAKETVTVDFATADGSGPWAGTQPATAGADYTATSGTLAFAPGETLKTVSVPILDDAVDEGLEYFLLRFSNPQGATLEARYREVQGLIRNDDHLQAMWLARFGRAVGTQVTDAVSERLEAGLSPGVHATLAGQPIDLSQADDGQALAQTMTGLARAFGAPGAAAPNNGSFAQHEDFSGGWNAPADSASARDMTERELLLGSSFHLAGEGEGSGPGLAVWGRMAHARFDGEHADDTGRTRVDGEVVTGVLGADADFGRLLAGVAIGLSEGDGTFDAPAVDVGATGGIESTMTTVNPYARFTLTPRVSAWGLVGLGTGDMTIRFDDGGMDPIRTDTGLRMGALGMRGALLQQDAAGDMDLALKADAFYLRVDSQQSANSVQTDAAASRVRLMLEGGRRFSLGTGATLRPLLEVGLRHDGGDAETGTGVELGGGVAYIDAALGLSIEVRARILPAHANSDYEEWGVSATARLDPGERGRGLSFSLSPAVGATASAAQQLWGTHEASGLAPGAAPFEASGGLHAEAGYGLPLFGDRFTGTPNLGFALSDGGARDYRIGWRLTSAMSGGPGFQINFDAARRNTRAQAENRIGVSVATHW